jgi:hypothetical protein
VAAAARATTTGSREVSEARASPLYRDRDGAEFVALTTRPR